MSFLLIFLFSFHSMAVGSGCMTRHLTDAVVINEARKPIYSLASQGASTEASGALIAFETSLLSMAKWADFAAIPLQHQGVPVLCNDLRGMSLAPSLNPRLPTVNRPEEKDFVF